MTSSDKSIVVGFFSELSKKADYGIKGEKPLAVIAALKYLSENKIGGKRLLDLLAAPHINPVKRIFIDLARTYSPINEPDTSWDLIAGKKGELRDTILEFRAGDVNEAFSKLTPKEVEELLRSYINYLTRRH